MSPDTPIPPKGTGRTAGDARPPASSAPARGVWPDGECGDLLPAPAAGSVHLAAISASSFKSGVKREYSGDITEYLVYRAFEEDLLEVGEAHPCPYLPGRIRRTQCLPVGPMWAEMYHDMLHRGCRRQSIFLYRVRCPECRACVPIRIPVAGFTPSRSQRRVLRRNCDVSIHTVPAMSPATDEVLGVYQRYLDYQHPGTPQMGDRESMELFLYEKCVNSFEVSYRVGGRLMGVSILDVCRRSWSSVYHFFDPDFARRSPGVLSVLAEIEVCRRAGVPYYYLGYWIAGCPTMAYKADYRPCEILVGGVWQELTSVSPRPP